MSTANSYFPIAKNNANILDSIPNEVLDEIGIFTTKNTRNGVKSIFNTSCAPIEYVSVSSRYTDNRKVYHVEDIQNILQISRTSAYSLIKTAPFRVVRIGSTIRISKEDFDKWLNNSEEGEK